MSEDVVQQTLLKALIHGRQFRFESALKSWLFRIAVNEARQIYRSSRRTEVVSLDTVAAAGANPKNNYAARERTRRWYGTPWRVFRTDTGQSLSYTICNSCPFTRSQPD